MLTVSADVSQNCSIDAATELSFGTYVPASPVPTDATASLTVSCADASFVVITLGQGAHAAPGSSSTLPLRQMSAGGASRLAYQLYRDAARTLVWGNTQATSMQTLTAGVPEVLTIYGRAAAGQAVLSGSYADTVLATVTY